MTVSKNLILAFAPGSRGFLLSKWLYNNQLVNLIYPPENNSYIVNGDNHALNPFYNDVLFYWDPDSKDTYFKIEKEIKKTNCDYTLLKQLLSTSKFLPNIHNSQYNLILSHHASKQGLLALKLALDAQLIRITLDINQANSCYQRKYKPVELEFDLTEYYPYMETYNFAINIGLDQVENLDLNFLKELL